MRTLALMLLATAVAAAETADPDRYAKETVIAGLQDVTDFEIAPDGRIVLLELAGAVKIHDPATRATSVAGAVPALVGGDAGALGIALDRDFAESGQVFLLYAPDAMPREMRLVRVTIRDGAIDPALTRTLLEFPLEPDRTPSHCGGGLWMQADGTLVVGTGDNTPAQDMPAVHPAEARFDSRRTAANSRDFRGKILRIIPQPDGTYLIPPGNLFADPADGLPEIFAFGVRNPFRVAVDPLTSRIAWGDVGGNVKPDAGLGPEGYDEINIATEPGFFGWPFSSGPNEPWRPYDAETRRPSGPPFEPAHPVNDSPRNTGLRELPPSRPAAIYFSGGASAQWPFFGTGGRSVTGGVFVRMATEAPDRLPDSLEGAYVFGEWMRNWLALARFGDDGSLASVEPFLPHLTFSKPSAFRMGPDGALYLAEMGDRWTGNIDSRITRIVYRRGNRPPVARAVASRTSGGLPLTIEFRAGESADPDAGDRLTFRWDFGNGESADGDTVTHEFATAGVRTVTLTATDPHGLAATETLTITAGNEAPTVSFPEPADGSFFEWDKPVPWRVVARDKEDGELPAGSVLVQLERRNRLAAGDDVAAWPGLALMRNTTCFACHSATDPSAGPPYAEVARRYAGDAGARDALAARIVAGGSGVWGPLPMPPHPQHTVGETAQMVDWILSLAAKRIESLPTGLTGEAVVSAPERAWNVPANGLIVLTASAVDTGGPDVPPRRGTASVVLRTPQQRACFFDSAFNAVSQDNLEQGGQVARIRAPDGWIGFDRVRLDGIRGVLVRCWPQGDGGMTLQARTENDNEILGQAALSPGSGRGRPAEVRLLFDRNPGGLHRFRLAATGDSEDIVDVMSLEFLLGPATDPPK